MTTGLSAPPTGLSDTIRLPQGLGATVGLKVVIGHAYEIERSNPVTHYVLVKFPYLRDLALQLIAAHKLGAPLSDLHEHAERLNAALLHVKAAQSLPNPNKPTVGKAADRLGEKARKQQENATRRAERRALTAKPTPVTLTPAAPAGSPWEGLL